MQQWAALQGQSQALSSNRAFCQWCVLLGHGIKAGIPSSVSSHDVESEVSDDIGDVATPKDKGTTSWMAPAHDIQTHTHEGK